MEALLDAPRRQCNPIVVIRCFGTPVIDYLGQLRTDAQGRGAPPDFAPRIASSVTLYDLLYDMAIRQLPLPPSTLYDDGGPLASLRRLKADFQPSAEVEFPTYVPDYNTEILPVLDIGYRYRWVSSLTSARHASLISPTLGDPNPKYASARAKVFAYLRAPEGARAGTGARSMPRLLGDDPYIGNEPEYVRRFTLTRTQFGLVRRWAAGAFKPAAPPSLPPAEITPHGLDQAAAENCCGGPFYPGIEVSFQIRAPGLFLEPFRLDPSATSRYWGEEGKPLRAGHFSRQMAVPWQADFNDCTIEGNFSWWPSQRPDDVFVSAKDSRPVPWSRPTTRFVGGNQASTHEDMVTNWYKFGFVVEQWGGAFLETERDPQIA